MNAIDTDILPVAPVDPAMLGYPPTLPVEVALRTASPRAICEAYGISREEWQTLIADERFRADVQRAVDMLKQEGMSFKMKAQLQAEELLTTSWRMIHSHDEKVPPSVKADLLKFTIRAAGLDGSADRNNGNAPAVALQINLNLG